MAQDGRLGIDFARVASREEHAQLLRKKLIEEAAEYVIEPSITELADLLETLHALAHIDLEMSWLTIRRCREAKLAYRGGFHKGWVMRSITSPPDGSRANTDHLEST